MVEIIDQDLPLSLPSGHLNLVFMQPFIHFERPLQEPYRWQPRKALLQIRAIERTLGIARGPSNASHAHFTIFPEYAIPGTAGVAAITEAVESADWPRQTIVIGGIDGLNRKEYRSLCEGRRTFFAANNAPEKVQAEQWVNTSITWAKDRAGLVSRWLQPKLIPSEPERITPCQRMFRGGGVHVFSAKFDNGSPCRFLSLICFDWIAPLDGRHVQERILSVLNSRWKSGDPRSLHWVFVIQQNPDPNNPAFLQRTEEFLLQHTQYPHVNRHDTCIIMANNALTDGLCEPKEGGFTSLVFGPNSPFVWKNECRPTVSIYYGKHRQNGGFNRCKDVTFIEMAPCIQSAQVAVAPWIGSQTTDRCSAVEGGSVYALQTPCNDARFPERSVPPPVKWVNDQLDLIPFMAQTDMRNRPLKGDIQISEENKRSQLRIVEGSRLTQFVRKATWVDEKLYQSIKNSTPEIVDLWDDAERQGLEHAINTLSILGICYPLQVSGSDLHGIIRTPSGPIRLVAIRGPSHEECRRYFDRGFAELGPDAVLLVTRDQNNLSPTDDEVRKIYESRSDNRLRHADYSTIIGLCRRAKTKKALKESLREVLKPHEDKFV
jgi:hypothetical protein